jgi:riboflavin synthase
MFTGIIEEIGTIKNITNYGNARKLEIISQKILLDSKIDDSISIDGVCQTIIDIKNNSFTVEAVEETILKTNFNNLRNNDKVNLERALKLDTRLGGHLVQGHIDCIGKITSIVKQSLGILLTIEFPIQYKKYIVLQGSIAVNGISLTVARITDFTFTVSVIPHTWNNTTLKYKGIGSIVNLEFDLLAKYVENMLYINNNADNNILSKFIDQPY